MKKSDALNAFLKELQEDFVSFEEADFSDISWCNHEGENALHIAVIRGEYDICKELIELGIELNARGDLGRTPLHEAASMQELKFVKLLVEAGADTHALDEGVPPFTLARYNRKDDICDYLGEAMKQSQSHSPKLAKAQIAYLQREIERIKKAHNL